MKRKRYLVIEEELGFVRVKNGDGVSVTAGTVERALQKAADATFTDAALTDVRSGADAAEFIDTLLGKHVEESELRVA